VNSVWGHPNYFATLWDQWEPYVLVTGGGIVCVAAWVASLAAWVLALSAMIKYDTAAAEQAVVDHALRKEEAAKRRLEIIVALGEGAARAAREGIPLELGDKLYLGGVISTGAVSGVAWANMGIAQYLLADRRSLSSIAGAFLIVNVVASTTASVVLLLGLTDVLSRVKAATGGFAVMAVVTAVWILDFGMAVKYLQMNQFWLLTYQVTVGSVGILFALGTTGVLYHPMKIWDKLLKEQPRPAKIFYGGNGKALAITSGMFALFAFGLACGAIPIFMYTPAQFVGYVPTSAPTPARAPTEKPACSNGMGAPCNLGNSTQWCCMPPYQCIESSYTVFTCEESPFESPLLPRTSFGVGQAFLALTLAFATMALVFSEIALAPNGVMDANVSLSVSMSTSLAAFACGVIAFAVLQSFVLQSNGTGVPQECGMLLGAFVCSAVSAGTAFCTWLPFHLAFPGAGEAQQLKREAAVEQLRIELLELRAKRMALERAAAASMAPAGSPAPLSSAPTPATMLLPTLNNVGSAYTSAAGSSTAPPPFNTAAAVATASAAAAAASTAGPLAAAPPPPFSIAPSKSPATPLSDIVERV